MVTEENSVREVSLVIEPHETARPVLPFSGGAVTDDLEQQQPSIADEVEKLHQEAEAAFSRGYNEGVVEGRRQQANDDQYYIDRAERLSQLLAQAEAEIQRLRNLNR